MSIRKSTLALNDILDEALRVEMDIMASGDGVPQRHHKHRR